MWGELSGSKLRHNALTKEYRLLYGGIDSDGIIESVRGT